MKRIHRFLSLATVGTLVIAIAITACRRKNKEEAVEPDPDLTTERNISNAINDDNSIMKDIDKALDNSDANLREETTSSYFTLFKKDTTVTIGGIEYFRYIKITYTASADDGQLRSGNVEIFAKGNRITCDFKSYVSFSGAKIGGRAITGLRIIAQESSGNDNKWLFSIVGSGTVSTVDGVPINYSSERMRERTGVSTLLDPSDDIYSIKYGYWSGNNLNSESITTRITAPLQLSYSCRNFREITSGKIDFINNDKGITRSVDYGSGGCDGKGTFINAKGKSFIFNFQR